MLWSTKLSILLASVTVALATSCPDAQETYEIPSAVSNASSNAQFTSCAAGFDAPKVQPVNASAFDWWYFDVVATNQGSLASVVIVFFTAPATAFPFNPPSDNVLSLYLSISFPNGTVFSTPHVFADNATVTTVGNGSSGDWAGSGLSWTYSPDSGYTILIDSLEMGVLGSISLNPVRTSTRIANIYF